MYVSFGIIGLPIGDYERYKNSFNLFVPNLQKALSETGAVKFSMFTKSFPSLR